MDPKIYSAWRNNDNFEKNTGPDFMVTRIARTPQHGLQAAIKAARSWSIADGVAIAPPNGGISLPPICIDQFAHDAKASYERKLKLEYGLLSAALVMFGATAVFQGRVINAIAPCIIIASTLAISIIDASLHLRKNSGLEERSRFIYWIIKNDYVRRRFMAVLIIGAILFGAQCYVENTWGGREQVLGNAGFLYRQVASGEYWRVISAPFIHTSFAHIANNVALAAIFLPFVSLFCRGNSVTYLFSGAVVGELAQWIIRPIGDVLVGFSGGVFALLGASLGVSVRKRSFFPAGLYWKIGYAGLITLLGAQLLNSQSAGICHLTGFLIGFLAELCVPAKVSNSNSA